MGKRKWRGNHGRGHGRKKPRHDKRVSPEEANANVKKCFPFLRSKIAEYGALKPKTATEKELGIQEYLSPQTGFEGLIKKRFEDFIVQEINEAGTIAKLTTEEALSDEEPIDTAVFGDEDKQKFATISTKAEAECLMKFFHNTIRGDKKARLLIHLCRPGDTVMFRGEKVEIESVTQEHCLLKKDKVVVLHQNIIPKFAEDKLKAYKQRRTDVHKWLNRRFPKCSHKTDEFGRIEVCRRIPRAKDKRWPKDKPPILKFILEKKGMNTHRALQMLSSHLKTNQKEFGFAGNKDKRGWTTQWVTANRINSLRVKKACTDLQGLSTGNFEYCPKETRLGLGSCKGNRFLLSIRDLRGNSSDISAALEHVRSHGFINYFGTQRFGVSSIGTHELGKYVFKKDWGMVVALLLTEQPGFSEQAKESVRAFWETGDSRNVTRRAMGMGSPVARYLSSNPESYQNAVGSIVREQRNLMVHAYQSHVWNLVASKRIRKHGLNVVADDLVLIGKKEVEFVGERISEFTIEDIVLPVPGFKMTYPVELKDYYEQIVKNDDLNLEDDFRYNSQGWDTSGDYRHIIRKPESLAWNVVHYSDENESFVEPYLREQKDLTSPSTFEIKERTALLVSFGLPKSSYATMFIRELMKIETTKQSLMEQNERQEKQDRKMKVETTEQSLMEQNECQEKQDDKVKIETTKRGSVEPIKCEEKRP